MGHWKRSRREKAGDCSLCCTSRGTTKEVPVEVSAAQLQTPILRGARRARCAFCGKVAIKYEQCRARQYYRVVGRQREWGFNPIDTVPCWRRRQRRSRCYSAPPTGPTRSARAELAALIGATARLQLLPPLVAVHYQARPYARYTLHCQRVQDHCWCG